MVLAVQAASCCLPESLVIFLRHCSALIPSTQVSRGFVHHVEGLHIEISDKTQVEGRKAVLYVLNSSRIQCKLQHLLVL